MTIPDSPRNLAAYGKQAVNHGGSGYPLLRLVALAACGTRTIIDAVFGPASTSEQNYTRRLRRSLHPGMLVLLDRNFDVAALLGQLAATGADLLVRVKANRKLPVLRRFGDGSYLTQIGTVRVRMTECEITIATSAGRHTGSYRLATTLLDHRQHPAAALVTLYHRRWEIETAYLELKSSLLGGRVLRVAGKGHLHSSELIRWDQAHPGQGGDRTNPSQALADLIAAGTHAAVVAPAPPCRLCNERQNNRSRSRCTGRSPSLTCRSVPLPQRAGLDRRWLGHARACIVSGLPAVIPYSYHDRPCGR